MGVCNSCPHIHRHHQSILSLSSSSFRHSLRILLTTPGTTTTYPRWQEVGTIYRPGWSLKRLPGPVFCFLFFWVWLFSEPDATSFCIFRDFRVVIIWAISLPGVLHLKLSDCPMSDILTRILEFGESVILSNLVSLPMPKMSVNGLRCCHTERWSLKCLLNSVFQASPTD